MAVIYVLHLEAQTLAKKQSNLKVFYITQLGHRYCLAAIVSILEICNFRDGDQTRAVAVQSQLCGALTFSSMISHYLACE